MYAPNCSMTQEQREALKSIDFFTTLNVEAAVSWLYAKDYLKVFHVERIEAKKISQGLTASRVEFLKILPSRGQKAYVEFYACLLSKDGANQQHLAKLLESALPIQQSAS